MDGSVLGFSVTEIHLETPLKLPGERGGNLFLLLCSLHLARLSRRLRSRLPASHVPVKRISERSLRPEAASPHFDFPIYWLYPIYLMFALSIHSGLGLISEKMCVGR